MNSSNSSKQEIIRNIPVFSGLDMESISALARHASEKTYSKGEFIFSEGDRADGFHILTSGRMTIFKLSQDGREQILHIFSPGQIFGEAAVFSGGVFPASAQAVEKSSAIFIPKATLTAILEKNPQAAMTMLAVLSARLRHFASLVESLSLKEVPSRLASHLILLDAQDGSDTVHVDITRTQLASLLGTIPETLSRILNRMNSAGIIKVKGRKITILNREKLEDLATGHFRL